MPETTATPTPSVEHVDHTPKPVLLRLLLTAAALALPVVVLIAYGHYGPADEAQGVSVEEYARGALICLLISMAVSTWLYQQANTTDTRIHIERPLAPKTPNRDLPRQSAE